MNRKLSCPKCAKPMEEGFVPDLVNNGGKVISTWVAGPPEQSFWLGLKTGDREKIPIRTFRCSGCGYLESYADKEENVGEKA